MQRKTKSVVTVRKTGKGQPASLTIQATLEIRVDDLSDPAKVRAGISKFKRLLRTYGGTVEQQASIRQDLSKALRRAEKEGRSLVVQ